MLDMAGRVLPGLRAHRVPATPVAARAVARRRRARRSPSAISRTQRCSRSRASRTTSRASARRRRRATCAAACPRTASTTCASRAPATTASSAGGAGARPCIRRARFHRGGRHGAARQRPIRRTDRLDRPRPTLTAATRQPSLPVGASCSRRCSSAAGIRWWTNSSGARRSSSRPSCQAWAAAIVWARSSTS